MKKMYSLGVHTFYRPRAWGDGADAPVWGNTPDASKADGTAKPEAAKIPQAAASPPERIAGKTAPTAKL
jgi:hypothetical protein